MQWVKTYLAHKWPYNRLDCQLAEHGRKEQLLQNWETWVDEIGVRTRFIFWSQT